MSVCGIHLSEDGSLLLQAVNLQGGEGGLCQDNGHPAQITAHSALDIARILCYTLPCSLEGKLFGEATAG